MMRNFEAKMTNKIPEEKIMEKLKFSEFSPIRLENLESLLEYAFKFFTDVYLGLDDKDLAERDADAESLKSDTYVNYLSYHLCISSNSSL